MFRARVLAASMAIDNPEATAGAVPLGTLTAQEELSCFARNGGANPGVLMRPVAWGGVRQGKKVVTTLLRRSGRGEAVLRADQPITRGHWTRAGTDNPRRSRRSWRPVRRDRTGTTSDETTSVRKVRPGLTPPPALLLGGSRHPTSSGPPSWWQAKDDLRTGTTVGPMCWPIRA